MIYNIIYNVSNTFEIYMSQFCFDISSDHDFLLRIHHTFGKVIKLDLKWFNFGKVFETSCNKVLMSLK